MRRVILLLAVMAMTLVVASGVALAVNKVGTNGPDTLRGTNGDDNLVGRGGNDRLFALDGRDNLVGGPGKDWVDTHPTEFRSGDKNLEGGAGNDAVFGGKGSDKVVGNEGNDWLWDGPIGRDVITDRLSAGDGNDVVDVYNDPVFKDIVTCGDGFDWVFADRKDVIAPDCERVFIGSGSIDEFLESIPESFWEGLPPLPFL
jgi:Ca2+-binding RTX toxin-like protein